MTEFRGHLLLDRELHVAYVEVGIDEYEGLRELIYTSTAREYHNDSILKLPVVSKIRESDSVPLPLGTNVDVAEFTKVVWSSCYSVTLLLRHPLLLRRIESN